MKKAKICRECGATIPPHTNVCPRCGLQQSLPRGHKKFVNILGIAGIAMVVFFIYLFSCSGEDKRFEMAGQYKGSQKEAVEFFYLTTEVEENDLRTHAMDELSGKYPQAIFYYTHPVRILEMEGLDSFERVIEAACRNHPVACAWYIPLAEEKKPVKNFRMYPSFPLSVEKPRTGESSSSGDNPVIINL